MKWWVVQNRDYSLNSKTCGRCAGDNTTFEWQREFLSLPARLAQCANPGTFNTFGFCPTKSKKELSTRRGFRSWDFNGIQTVGVNL